MEDLLQAAEKPTRHSPWNKGKLVGAKPSLRPSHVWSIRTKLQIEGRTRDLAPFNLAIDSKLRGCDVSQSAPMTWRRMVMRSIARLAYAGMHPREVAGVINFVRGWMGDRCPNASEINAHAVQARRDVHASDLVALGQPRPLLQPRPQSREFWRTPDERPPTVSSDGLSMSAAV
jgi:hypothetical protein